MLLAVPLTEQPSVAQFFQPEGKVLGSRLEVLCCVDEQRHCLKFDDVTQNAGKLHRETVVTAVTRGQVEF